MTHDSSGAEHRSTPLTRRSFLHRTAAALAAPLVITRPSWGRARVAANDRLTVGVIGVGKRGRTLWNGFLRRDDVQIVAVNDVSTVRREHAKSEIEKHYAARKESGEYKGCAAYADFRELLARDDIDAVVIATPDHWHEQPVILAARAGKDMYCEKPLSLTIAQAKRMIDEVTKAKVVFQTGSQQRSEFGGKFHIACELVRAGRIGTIKTVHVGVGGPSKLVCDLPGQPVPEGLDWDQWLGPAPTREYNETICPKGVYDFFPAWRSYHDYSGGAMTDMGAHHFDIAQWGLDMDRSGPVEIIPPDGKDHDTLTYRYANGVLVYHGGGARDVRFTGTDGVIEVGRSNFETEPASLAEEKLDEADFKLYYSRNHIANFLECVASRKETVCPIEVGARSVTVCHLGNLAYWNKRRLRWDPAKWEFIGDDEANTWRDRPKREPWDLL